MWSYIYRCVNNVKTFNYTQSRLSVFTFIYLLDDSRQDQETFCFQCVAFFFYFSLLTPLSAERVTRSGVCDFKYRCSVPDEYRLIGWPSVLTFTDHLCPAAFPNQLNHCLNQRYLLATSRRNLVPSRYHDVMTQRYYVINREDRLNINYIACSNSLGQGGYLCPDDRVAVFDILTHAVCWESESRLLDKISTHVHCAAMDSTRNNCHE